MTAPAARRSSTPGRHVYDAVVLGGQVGGALCAALLARRGLQVLYVEHDGGTAGYVHGEWRLPHAPFVMPPLKGCAVLEAALEELSLTTSLHRLVRSPQPGPQVLRERQWLDLHADPERRQKELERLLGKKGGDALEATLAAAVAAADASEAFVASRPEIPPEGVFARWRLGGLLDRFPGAAADTPLSEQEPLPRLLRALLPLVSFAEAPGPLGRARLLGRLLSGPTLVPGGREGLARIFAERARELGADVVDGEDHAHSVVFEGSKAVGVRLTRAEQVYRAGLVVAALDAPALAALVGEPRLKALGKVTAALPAARLLFSHHAVLPEAALPRGLGELALLEAADAELGAVQLQVTPARRAGQETDSPERLLTLSTVVPAALRAGGAAAAKALVDRLWGELEAVMPFTRGHALLESTPWKDAPRVADGAFEPHPLFALPETSVLGLTGLPMGAPWGHLVFAGRQVLPGLGLEGEVLTALRAAGRVEKALRKSDPLK